MSYVGHWVGRYYEEPGFVAGIDRYKVAISGDGEQFVPAGSGETVRDRRRQWIPVRGTGARYVRLSATEGFTHYAGAAELAVFERP